MHINLLFTVSAICIMNENYDKMVNKVAWAEICRRRPRKRMVMVMELSTDEKKRQW